MVQSWYCVWNILYSWNFDTAPTFYWEMIPSSHYSRWVIFYILALYCRTSSFVASVIAKSTALVNSTARGLTHSTELVAGTSYKLPGSGCVSQASSLRGLPINIFLLFCSYRSLKIATGSLSIAVATRNIQHYFWL